MDVREDRATPQGVALSLTHCPRCGKPAVLSESRSVGVTWVPELKASVEVVERRISCPAPAGCGGDGVVHVVHRVELYRGTSTKRTVARARQEKDPQLRG